MQSKLEFRVIGLDCVNEVNVLKRSLAQLVPDENDLVFDLLNGKLTIKTSQQKLDSSQIIKLIEKTGMTAIAWDIYLEDSVKNKTAFWSNNKELILTITSGSFLFFGYIAHALQHGYMNALIGTKVVGIDFPVGSIIFYLISIINGCWFIFPKALKAARYFRPDMNLLMLIAVVGAVVIGQWFEAATVAFLFSLALLLETWSVGRARKAIQTLLASSPKTAWVINSSNNKTKQVLVKDINIGETLLIRPGEKIPLDGYVIKGQTSVNQAPITGESMPVLKNISDKVYAGTINEDGSIEVRVSKLSTDTTFAKIIRSIEEAQANRSHSEQWIDVFAHYYTPIMISLALAIMLVPPLLFDQLWFKWIYEGLVILVIACPCALVISTPVSIVAGLSKAARKGVLIKGGVYLELPAKLEAIAFDKTGTLTKGEPSVDKIEMLNNHSEEQLLMLASSLEFNSQHPLSKAICRCASQKNIKREQVDNFNSIKGKGIEGSIDGDTYWIGSHNFLHEKLSASDAKNAHDKAMLLEASGQTVVILGQGDHVYGLIGLTDTIRPEAKSVFKKLRKLGVSKLIMLTGDNLGTAKAISNKIQIDEYQAELLPDDKIKHVKLLRDNYLTVGMVGDGVNDAPAMATASLGIAMGAMGSDAAIETADIALMTDDLSKIPWLIQHSRQTMLIIKQNIVFALLTKAIFIILALLGVATLWMAIAADMGTSLIVIFNGLRLLKVN